MTTNFPSVLDAGAVGDGSPANAAKNRAAIQAALDAGGLVYVPPGTYYIDDTLRLRPGVRLMGASTGVSILRATHTGHVLQATDVIGLALEHLTIKGPGSGSGHGLYLHEEKRSCNYVTIRNVDFVTTGGDGIRADHLIVSAFDNVVANTCGGNGFTLLRGTSTRFGSTFAVACKGIGYDLASMTYCSFRATAADFGMGGYRLKGCSNIALDGCGCESVNGTGVLIDGSYNVTLDAIANYDNRDTFIHVTGQSSRIKIVAPREVTAAESAVASIRVDPRCRVSIESPNVRTPMELAAKSMVFPDSIHQAIKNTDTIRASTALTDDPELSAYLQDPRSAWVVEATLVYSAPLGVDLQIAWTLPADATASGETRLIGTGHKTTATVRGLLRLGTTTGAVGLRWAASANANTTLHRDSTLELRRVA